MTCGSKFFLTLAGLVLLTGCETVSSTITPVTPVATEPDIVTIKLALAAEKAAKALDIIASIDQQRNPAAFVSEDYSSAPANLMQPVSLRWSGPIDKAVRALAERAGMRFHIKGKEPAVPVLVELDVYQQPILHVMRNLGLQAGRRADVSVDGTGGVVELRYAVMDAAPETIRSSEIK